jgi:hypothetical protein
LNFLSLPVSALPDVIKGLYQHAAIVSVVSSAEFVFVDIRSIHPRPNFHC